MVLQAAGHIAGLSVEAPEPWVQSDLTVGKPTHSKTTLVYVHTETSMSFGGLLEITEL